MDSFLAAIPLFLLSAALAGFYGGAVAGLTALGRLLSERERPSQPGALASFILRDAPAAVTAWVVGGLWAGVGAALALGAWAARSWSGLPLAAIGPLAQLLCATALLASLLSWKRLAEAFPRAYCEVAAVLAVPFFLLIYPVRRPLAAALLRLYPPLTLRDGVLFADDVEAIAEGEEGARLLDRDEREMISRVIELSETLVREIMVPRIDIVAIEAATPIPEVIRIMQRDGHSRLPVYRDTMDDIVGFLYAKDLITHFDRLERLQLRELVRPTSFVPETKKVGDLLAEMRARRIYLAIVVDEYGGTAGLVTMEDVIEEVVGEIHDELDEEAELVHAQDDGSYRVDAKVHLYDLNERLHVALPADEYDTLGGFLYALAGSIPSAGDRFEHDGIEFTIAGVRGRRITAVQVRPLRPRALQEARDDRAP
jgi:CBS domain containing-hemolysin-like protein